MSSLRRRWRFHRKRAFRGPAGRERECAQGRAAVVEASVTGCRAHGRRRGIETDDLEATGTIVGPDHGGGEHAVGARGQRDLACAAVALHDTQHARRGRIGTAQLDAHARARRLDAQLRLRAFVTARERTDLIGEERRPAGASRGVGEWTEQLRRERRDAAGALIPCGEHARAARGIDDALRPRLRRGLHQATEFDGVAVAQRDRTLTARARLRGDAFLAHRRQTRRLRLLEAQVG